ncbi:hypothetical protein BJ508DRAFT_348721, partial [Ascobolus immersus RN42]
HSPTKHPFVQFWTQLPALSRTKTALVLSAPASRLWTLATARPYHHRQPYRSSASPISPIFSAISASYPIPTPIILSVISTFHAKSTPSERMPTGHVNKTSGGVSKPKPPASKLSKPIPSSTIATRSKSAAIMKSFDYDADKKEIEEYERRFQKRLDVNFRVLKTTQEYHEFLVEAYEDDILKCCVMEDSRYDALLAELYEDMANKELKRGKVENDKQRKCLQRGILGLRGAVYYRDSSDDDEEDYTVQASDLLGTRNGKDKKMTKIPCIFGNMAAGLASQRLRDAGDFWTEVADGTSASQKEDELNLYTV